MNKSIFILPVFVIVIVALLSSIFIVDEREKALVLRFGRVVQTVEEPGLNFRVPLIDQVVEYDDRIISIDMAAQEVIPNDDRRLIVDAFARYRISDVELFRQATGAGGDQAIAVADNRLERILNAQTRAVLGSVSSGDILSTDRDALMLRIRNGAIQQADELGLTVIDVRLKRTDLPSQNLERTFLRMVSERQREAEDERARGREAATRITAQADRTVAELESDARRQARIIEGEADAESNATFAQAYGQDAEFFEFYRSLEAYRTGLATGNARMVMSPPEDFFDYLRSPRGNTVASPEPVAATAAAEDGATAQSDATVPAADEGDAGVPAGDTADADSDADAAEGTATE